MLVPLADKSLRPELKLPAAPLKRDLRFSGAAGSLRNVRKRFHFIVVRSLIPQQAEGLALAVAFSTSRKRYQSN